MRKTLTVLATTAVLSLGLVACGDDDAVSEEDRDRAAAAAVEAAGGGTALSVDRGDEDDLFEYEVEVEREGGDQVDVRLDEDFEVVGDVPQAAPSASAAPSDDPSASASASASPSTGDDDQQLTGDTLEQASAAAIEAAGGEGRVTDAERSDDRDHAYDVEVRLPNGEDVDVDLDEQFGVVRVDR